MKANAMNKKQLLSAIFNRIEHMSCFDRHTTRCSDPTVYLKGSVWITFEYGAPAPFLPQEPDPEYPTSPAPATVKLSLLASWSTNLKLEGDGQVFECSIFDHTFYDNRGVMADDIEAFLIAALCDGQWSDKEPVEPTEEEIEAEAADMYLLRCAM